MPGHHDRRDERDPRPLAGPATPARALDLRERLLSKHVDAPIHAIADGISMRISAHGYNEIEDYKRLAEILRIR
jgi:hypothetical protein